MLSNANGLALLINFYLTQKLQISSNTLPPTAFKAKKNKQKYLLVLVLTGNNNTNISNTCTPIRKW